MRGASGALRNSAKVNPQYLSGRLRSRPGHADLLAEPPSSQQGTVQEIGAIDGGQPEYGPAVVIEAIHLRDEGGRER